VELLVGAHVREHRHPVTEVEKRRHGGDVPHRLGAVAHRRKPLEVGLGHLVGGLCQLHRHVEHRQPLLADVRLPVVRHELVSELRVPRVDAQQRAVGDVAVVAVVAPGDGDDNHLHLLAVQCGVVDQRVVVLEERPEVAGFGRERREHVRGEPGLVVLLADSVLKILGQVDELGHLEAGHRVIVERRLGHGRQFGGAALQAGGVAGRPFLSRAARRSAVALAPPTRAALRRHWANRLGCSPGAFDEAGVTFCRRSDSQTVRVLRRGDATVISSPERIHDRLSARTQDFGQNPLRAVGVDVRRVLAAEDAEAADVRESADVHGPVEHRYVEPSTVSSQDDARLLDAADEASFEALRERVPDDEWARASPTFRADRSAGLFRDGELVAAATLGDPPFGDVGVVVDTDHRGEGYGQAVVSRVVAATVDRDEEVWPHYRTPVSASASVALANSLGFEHWATEVIVSPR